MLDESSEKRDEAMAALSDGESHALLTVVNCAIIAVE